MLTETEHFRCLGKIEAQFGKSHSSFKTGPMVSLFSLQVHILEAILFLMLQIIYKYDYTNPKKSLEIKNTFENAISKRGNLAYFDKYTFSCKCNLSKSFPAPTMLEKGSTLVLILLSPKFNSKINFINFIQCIQKFFFFSFLNNFIFQTCSLFEIAYSFNIQLLTDVR